jgi:uncharacterized repeat protein (TIGR01451 family)
MNFLDIKIRRKEMRGKIILLFLIFSIFSLLLADDSRNNPVTAKYCDGSSINIYPYSHVTRYDGSTFDCYEVKVEQIVDGLRYGFEDWSDYDYNDVVIELWVTGNGTSNPVAHVKFVSKDAGFNHKIHIVYNGTDLFIFDANNATPGQIFDINLPAKPCPDFSINVTPPQRSIYPGDSTHYNVVVHSINGFKEPVYLSVEGLPLGAVGKFDDNPVIPTGETKLRIETNKNVSPGIYTLTVKGEGGGKIHTATVLLEIKSCPDFSVEIGSDVDSGPLPLTVHFKSIVKGPEEINYNYLWNFGDGETSNEKDPIHTFKSIGTFNVKLKVENPCGVIREAQKQIKVFPFKGYITKSFSKKEALPGESLSFEIYVKNESEYDWGSFTIWDELSPSIIYIRDNAPSEPIFEGRKVKWMIKGLRRGDYVRIVVDIKVSEDSGEGNIENRAFVEKEGEPPIPSNIATLQVNIGKGEIKKSVDKEYAKPGDTIKYEIKLENQSNIPLTNLRVEDRLSQYLEFQSQNSEFEFEREGELLVWKGRIEAKKTSTIQILAKIKGNIFSGTKITNSAILTAKELREKIESNTVTTEIKAEPIPATSIKFTKRAEVSQSEVGRVITFRLTVENQSPSYLLSSTIEDILPQGFNYVSMTTLLNGERFAEPDGRGRLLWKIPDIGPYQTFVLRFQVIIGADARRGRNINKAIFRCTDNSGQNINIEAHDFINVSSSSFTFFSGVEGYAFIDNDGDGSYSPLDTPLNGVEIYISTGQRVATDSKGYYSFENLYPGEYTLGIDINRIPEGTELASSRVVPLSLSDGFVDRVDFSFKKKSLSEIKGFVYFERNGNGKFDEGEIGLKGVGILLSGLSSTSTNDKGEFSFKDLKPGKYTLRLVTSTLPKGAKILSGKSFELEIKDYGETKIVYFPISQEPFLKINLERK